jgi:hypothetical protein
LARKGLRGAVQSSRLLKVDALWDALRSDPRFADTIRAWLGHVSVDTTNVYAEVGLEMKAKALAACDTGGNSVKKKMWRQTRA